MNEQRTPDELAIRRTELNVDADRLDLELYRLISRVEAVAEKHKRKREVRKLLLDSIRGLRGARVGLRSLMHEYDRKETI